MKILELSFYIFLVLGVLYILYYNTKIFKDLKNYERDYKNHQKGL